MSQVINTNVMSLNAQRNLANSGGQLAVSLQRLSSGLRINSAKDDAAGLAISERFTTQIRGLNQAIRNSNDGISLAQTGEGALQEISNNLQRIRELAVQSANATNSASDRAALDAEVQQRLAEVNRIANQTSFNGQKILDGSFGSAVFQVGANVGETISLSLGTSMRTTDIGAIATATSVDLGTLISEAEDAVPTTSVAAGAFTDATGATGSTFTLTVGGVQIVDLATTGAAVPITAADLDADFDVAAQGALAAAGITFSGSFADGTMTFTRADGQDFDVARGGTAAGGTFADGAFVGTHSNGTEASPAEALTITDLTLQIGDAEAVAVTADDYDSVQGFIDALNSALGSDGTATLNENGTVSILASQPITISGADQATVFSAASYAASGDLAGVTVTSVSAANDAIQRIDSALTAVSSLRSDFGAVQNRFESVIANLNTVSENLSASRSRIMDADFAAETANLTRAQVLQQAGVAILAQANAMPQNVLALLR